MKHFAFACSLSLAIVGCSDDPANETGGCAEEGTCDASPMLEIGGDRPAPVTIPSDYETSTRYPLMIVLHGFGVNGTVQAGYFELFDQVEEKQFVLVAPDGTANDEDKKFWNATAACCAETEQERAVDDVGYIRGLIEEARATYSIDRDRVYLFGHSNGGFMSFRMACEASDVITAIVSLAGSTFNMESECTPATTPVSVLAIHGDADQTVFYAGAAGVAPGAIETTMRFADRAGCDGIDTPANLDIDASIEGAETTVKNYQNCDSGLDVALWTIVGGTHIPIPWTDSFANLTTDWMLAHSR